MLCSRYFSVVGSYSLYSSTWQTTWEGKVCDMSWDRGAMGWVDKLGQEEGEKLAVLNGNLS